MFHMYSPETTEKMLKMEKIMEDTFSVIGTLPDEFNADYLKSASLYDNIRTTYVRNSYVILTDELMKSITSMFDKLYINTVMELAAGTGWFTHWLKKYSNSINYRCVDDFSWEYHSDYLDVVEQGDACVFVNENPQVDLFILAWPHSDDKIASGIWNSLKPGQYLLYLGETQFGCCAESEFFTLVDEYEVIGTTINSVKNVYKTFYGLHDCAYLYRKGL